MRGFQCLPDDNAFTRRFSIPRINKLSVELADVHGAGGVPSCTPYLWLIDGGRQAHWCPHASVGSQYWEGWVSGDMGSMLPGQCSRGWPPMRQTGAAVPGLFWNLLMKNKLIRRLRASKVKLKWLPFYCWVYSVLNILFFIIQRFESDYFKFKSKTLDFDRRLGMLLCEGLCNCSGLESAFKVSSEEASKKVNYLNC